MPSSGSQTVPTVGLNAPSPFGNLTPEMSTIVSDLAGAKEPAEVRTGRPLGDSNIDELVMMINRIFGNGIGVMPQQGGAMYGGIGNQMLGGAPAGMSRQGDVMQQILAQMFYA